MIGVTIGVGQWRQAVEASAEAARKHTGLEVRVLGDADWAPFRNRYGHPAFLKLHLFELLPADDIFYFDADAIHINPWDPRQFAGRPAITAVVDRLIGGGVGPSGVSATEYFNAGMMIVNRKHHGPMLRLAQTLAQQHPGAPLLEQPWLNRARKQLGIPLNALDQRFNHVRFFDDPTFDPRETVIAHWTSNGCDPAVVEHFCRTGQVANTANAAAEAAAFVETIEPYPDRFSGRGIVICAGGPKYSPSAWVLVRLLRHLGCSLPIQVWYRGDEERDEAWIELISAYGVECVDAEAVRKKHPHLSLGGWELKAYAVLHSPFREVMLLDADNVPVRDPEYLFDTPGYQETGALFWPQGSRMSPGHASWSAFGVEYRDEEEFESGQLIIDKARCWRALNLCNWYNERSYFFYRVVYGDKDTFRFAWHRLGQPFAMPERGMGILSSTLLQYDPAGELIFQHRFGDKWRLSGNQRIPGFQHEAICNEFMHDLRQRWRVMRHITDKLDVADRQRLDALANARFEMVRLGHNRWPIQLAPSGFIDVGWSPASFFWWVEDGHLVLAGDDGRPTCRLAEGENGVWQGRSLRSPSMMYRLLPQPNVQTAC